MFAKPFTLSNSHKVSGADRKKLRRDIQARFPGAAGEGGEGVVEAVLPAKEGELTVTKFAAPARAALVALDGRPLLVDTSGKGDLFPTVFTLWRAPHLLPQVVLRGWEVSRFVLHGADLMLPGVEAAALPAGLARGDLAALLVPGNPAPLAVGRMLLSRAEALEREAAGAKGKLLELLHVFGDQLWAAGAAEAPVPNAGFYQDVVRPLPAEDDQAAGQPPAASAAGPSLGEEAAGGRQAGGEAGGAQEVADQLAGTSLAGSSGAGGGEAPAAEAGGANGQAEAAPPGAAAGPQDMDSLLEAALLQALHKSVPDSALPMAGAAFWANHMLPCRPPGAHLDLKKSKHKKLPKLLQAYGQGSSGCGLLRLTEDRRSKEVSLAAVDRSHPLYTAFRPHAAAGGAAADQAAATGSSAEAGSSGGSAPAGELVIEELYKPGPALAPVFAALGLSASDLYSPAQAAAVPFDYVAHAKLEQGAQDGAHILLDPLLCDALFKGVLKKGDTFPTQLPKAQLREAFMRRLVAQSRVSRGAASAVRRGALPPVLVSSERRQGSKRVTRVSGMEAFLVDPPALAAELQKQYASSAAVAELPGRGAGCEVVVQGGVADKLAQHLAKAYGIPKKYILVKEGK